MKLRTYFSQFNPFQLINSFMRTHILTLLAAIFNPLDVGLLFNSTVRDKPLALNKCP